MAMLALAALPGASDAQPAPPPPGWTGSAGAGLALTSGNSDTSTINAAYELGRDAGGAVVLTSSGLLVWGKSQGALTSDRLALAGRVERRLSPRTSVFGQTQFLRDSFKSIDYLVAPGVGVSRVMLKAERTELGVDAAVGAVWEQNPGMALTTDGAVSAGQRLAHRLTATTELTEKAAALWKMDDFGDALYTFGVGVAASVTAATQIKVEFLDTYKARPPLPTVRSNDIAVLVSFVYKFE